MDATHKATELLLFFQRKRRMLPTTKPMPVSEIKVKRTIFDFISVRIIEQSKANAADINATEIDKYIESGDPVSMIVSSLSDIS